MPGFIPLLWWRTRRTPIADRAIQQDPPLLVSVWNTDDTVQVFAIQQAWLTKGLQRDFTIRVWYARGVYGGRTIPSLSIRASALGSGDANGEEIVAEDYVLARLSGIGSYAGIGTADLAISEDEIPTNSYFDVDVRIAVPEIATTSGRFSVRLGFSIEDDIFFLGGDNFLGDGNTNFGGADLRRRTRVDRSKLILSGTLFTPAQKTEVENSGLTFPVDAAI